MPAFEGERAVERSEAGTRMVDAMLHLREATGTVPLLTSEGLGWRGIGVERHRHWTREIYQPPFEGYPDRSGLEPLSLTLEPLSRGEAP